MIIRILTTFLAFAYLTFGCEAEEVTYFDFNFEKDTLSSENTVDISFSYIFPSAIKETRFKIKPILDKGLAKVLVDEEWENAEVLWTDAINLSKNLKFKINGSFYKTELWFEILDLKTGKIYKTPKHPILNRNWFEKYLKNLNKIISDYTRNATMVE